MQEEDFSLLANFNLGLPEFSSAAWRASQASPAVSYFDFDWVIEVSRAYETYEVYSRMVDQVIDEVSSPSTTGVDRVRAILGRLATLTGGQVQVHRCRSGSRRCSRTRCPSRTNGARRRRAGAGQLAQRGPGLLHHDPVHPHRLDVELVACDPVDTVVHHLDGLVLPWECQVSQVPSFRVVDVPGVGAQVLRIEVALFADLVAAANRCTQTDPCGPWVSVMKAG